MAQNKLKLKVEALTNVVQQLIKEVQTNASLAQGVLTAFQLYIGKEEWDNIVEKLKTLSSDVKYYDTICAATKNRQIDAEKLAKESDVVVVKGPLTVSLVLGIVVPIPTLPSAETVKSLSLPFVPN